MSWAAFFFNCDDADEQTQTINPRETERVYKLAKGCYSLEAATEPSAPRLYLTSSSRGGEFVFASDKQQAAHFSLRAADLATYLLYDQQKQYLVAKQTEPDVFALGREATLLSAVLLLDDSYVSPAEWVIEIAARDHHFFQMHHHASGGFLTLTGLSRSEKDAALFQSSYRRVSRIYRLAQFVGQPDPPNDVLSLDTKGLNHGLIFKLGGTSVFRFDRCADPQRPGLMARKLGLVVEKIIENGGYPGIGFGFDFNGFYHGPRPRFGEMSACSQSQESPITYPFRSYAGDVTFQPPQLGIRSVDFNTEGMIHFGLLPELIEDARRTGVTDEELELIFRSAEAYIRMWEKAEQRSSSLRL